MARSDPNVIYCVTPSGEFFYYHNDARDAAEVLRLAGEKQVYIEKWRKVSRSRPRRSGEYLPHIPKPKKPKPEPEPVPEPEPTPVRDYSSVVGFDYREYLANKEAKDEQQQEQPDQPG